MGLLAGCASFPRAEEEGGTPWLEVSTSHFLLATDMDRRPAEEVATNLENWWNAMTAVVAESYWAQRFFSRLFTSFALTALFLAAIGIYGVMAYSVTQRTQEIGLRMALGAPPAQVIRLFLRQGLRLVMLGLVLGFAGAWIVARLLTSLLYGVSPHDPPTFAIVPIILAAVALLACWLPSRRATRIDPNAALRA